MSVKTLDQLNKIIKTVLGLFHHYPLLPSTVASKSTPFPFHPERK